MRKSEIIKITVAIILIASAFYWVEVRPYLDRKSCHDKAGNEAVPYGSPNVSKAFSIYDRYYTLCVNEHGLGE